MSSPWLGMVMLLDVRIGARSGNLFLHLGMFIGQLHGLWHLRWSSMLEMILSRLIALLGPLRAMSKDNREMRDNALRSISHALNETCIYYRTIERGKGRDTEVEDQLSRYWAAAAIPIRHLDPELAQICQYKSDYWLNPDEWTPEQWR